MNGCYEPLPRRRRRRRSTTIARRRGRVRPLRLRPRGRRPRARRRVPRTARHDVQQRADRAARASGCRCRRSSCRSCSRPTSAGRGRRARRRARARDRAAVTRRSTTARSRSSSTERRVVICCGSGGVGKTTTAAVLALEGARRGRNACVVTIDPAKRLADALGLEQLSDTPSEIDRDALGRAATPTPGRPPLRADARHEVDVRPARHAATPATTEQAERILDNTLLPQRLRRARRHAGVHGDGEAARAARRRRLRPHRRRHAADAPRARLPRRARAARCACSTTASSAC